MKGSGYKEQKEKLQENSNIQCVFAVEGHPDQIVLLPFSRTVRVYRK